MNNFERCEKEYLERNDYEEYENECENCGTPCKDHVCSMTCYKIMKADYEADQERD